MIAQLTGVILRTEAGSVVLDVNGVGYLVHVPALVLAALPEAGGKVTLRTHLVGRVQPDFEMSLYGFAAAEELQAFRLLIGVNGVGARVGLALLSVLTVSELARALSTSDTSTITRVPGVGPKLAQRLCLELGDKMAALTLDTKVAAASGSTDTARGAASYDDVVEALIQLGYGRADARRAADRAVAASAKGADTGALISAALQILTAPRR